MREQKKIVTCIKYHNHRKSKVGRSWQNSTMYWNISIVSTSCRGPPNGGIGIESRKSASVFNFLEKLDSPSRRPPPHCKSFHFSEKVPFHFSGRSSVFGSGDNDYLRGKVFPPILSDAHRKKFSPSKDTRCLNSEKNPFLPASHRRHHVCIPAGCARDAGEQPIGNQTGGTRGEEDLFLDTHFSHRNDDDDVQFRCKTNESGTKRRHKY